MPTRIGVYVRLARAEFRAEMSPLATSECPLPWTSIPFAGSDNRQPDDKEMVAVDSPPLCTEIPRLPKLCDVFPITLMESGTLRLIDVGAIEMSLVGEDATNTPSRNSQAVTVRSSESFVPSDR